MRPIDLRAATVIMRCTVLQQPKLEPLYLAALISQLVTFFFMYQNLTRRIAALDLNKKEERE